MALTKIDDRGLKTPIDLLDNEKIRFGTGNDLAIYHDGSDSQIHQDGVGDLQIRSDNSIEFNTNGTENAIWCDTDGAVKLYYDGSGPKLQTTSSGIEVSGNISIGDSESLLLGDGGDLQLYHSSSVNTIRNVGHRLDIIINSNENAARFYPNGSVELYHNNEKKLETTANGITVHDDGDEARLIIQGGEGEGATLYWYADDGDDDADKWRMAAGAGGSINLQNYASGSWENNIECNGNGNVELYYDNSKEFQTVANGIELTSDTSASGTEQTIYLSPTTTTDRSRSCSISGLNTDGNNNQALVFKTSAADTPAERLRITHGGEVRVPDNGKFTAGASDDLQIYHNGSHSFIKDAGTGGLWVYSNDFNVASADGSENIIKGTENGAVELYYDNSKKFETRSGGCWIGGNLEIEDSNKVSLGNSDDFKMYHDGTNSHIINDTGTLKIGCSNNVEINGYDGHAAAKFINDGAVELYFNNAKKFETLTDGAKVDGVLTTTSAIYCENEFNMTNQGDKYIDTAHLSHTLHFRRISGTDTGHSVQMTMASGGVISGDFNDTSDEKLKENIVAIPDGAISKVKQLRPVSFDWKAEDKANNVNGFIAQEVKTVLPNLVYGTEYDSTVINESQGIKSAGYSVNTIGIVANLTKALQEAITKIETLETEVAALKAK